MRLLNLGAGSNRPQSEIWWNLDLLRPSLALGTPERIQLDSEPRYIEHDLSSDSELPFEENSFDGVLFGHCLEHWTLLEGAKILGKIKRILKIEGVALVSVPDATIFRKNWPEDNVENAKRLFGEPIHLADGRSTFLDYAAFFREHRMLFTEDSLWCVMTHVRFENLKRMRYDDESSWFGILAKMRSLTNRIPFSLMMAGTKYEK